MDAAVDVQDLTGGHGQEVRQQGRAGPGHDVRVEDVPSERGPLGPGVLEGRESGDGLGGHGLHRTGGHQVHPYPFGPEIPGEVAGQRLERRLGHAHPVVDGPRHGGVEVEPHHGRAGPAVGAGGREQGTERLDQGLQGVRGDVQGDLDLIPVGPEDVAPEALRRGVPDGVEQSVESVPPFRELAAAVASWSGRVTSISSTSAGPGSFRAVRRVRESPRPAPLSTTSAPSCWAERATAKAREASVSTPVTRMRFPSRSPMRARVLPVRCREAHRRFPAVRATWDDRVAPHGGAGGVHKVWPMQIGILGGTGPAGRGLAVRLAAAGDEIVIGSRDAERAARVAADLVAAWPEHTLAITGVGNEACAAAPLVVVATPWDAAVATVTPLADALAGKVVVSMANALVKQGREFLALVPPRGSVAATIQAVLPESLVSASFHHLPASEMERLTEPMAADVLVCSDHRAASEATVALVDRIEGLRGVDAGSLSQAAAIEAFTAVLITVNIRHKVHAAVQLSGFAEA